MLKQTPEALALVELCDSGLMVVVMVAAPLVYVSAYCLLLEPFVLEPEYRWGGRFSKALFRPVHWVDKQLRPDRWRLFMEPDEFHPDFNFFAPHDDLPAEGRDCS